MLVVMHRGAREADVAGVLAAAAALGVQSQALPGLQRTAIAILGNPARLDTARFTGLAGVQKVIHVSEPYRLVTREARPAGTVIRLPGGLAIGGGETVVIAGPCAVEDEAQILATARAVAAAGAAMLRGGAYKPRSSPYSFQGLGARGLDLLAAARRDTGLLLVTEAMDEAGVERVAEVADVIQIGARNMQNSSLLRRVARAGKPVLLKRGMAATIEDLLLSAEYLLAEGQPDVILCERGIRGFDPATRNLFDVSAIPLVHYLSHLPIIADPSHGVGRRDLVPPVARAALAAGADGLMIEVHPDPALAQSDGEQSLTPEAFALLMDDLRLIGDALGRPVARMAHASAP